MSVDREVLQWMLCCVHRQKCYCGCCVHRQRSVTVDVVCPQMEKCYSGCCAVSIDKCCSGCCAVSIDKEVLQWMLYVHKQ